MEIDYEPSKIISMYLCKFDVHSGYELIWYKSNICNFNFGGLEYRSLPSGLHLTNSSTVLISHKYLNKIFQGVCQFHQQNNNINERKNDRKNINMYSLGILCDTDINIQTIDNKEKDDSLMEIEIDTDITNYELTKIMKNGWEYIDLLKYLLIKFFEQDISYSYEIFSIFYNISQENPKVLLKKENWNLIFLNSYRDYKLLAHGIPNLKNHMLFFMKDFIECFGASVFLIYKYSLLRKKILLFKVFKDVQDKKIQNFKIDSFNLIVSLLSYIPHEVRHLMDINNDFFLTPIYNIGLYDLVDENSLILNSFIGSTCDEIISNNKDFLNVGVFFLNSKQKNLALIYDYLFVKNQNSHIGTKEKNCFKATKTDCKNFKKINNSNFTKKTYSDHSVSFLSDLITVSRYLSHKCHISTFKKDLNDSESYFSGFCSFFKKICVFSIDWEKFILIMFSWICVLKKLILSSFYLNYKKNILFCESNQNNHFFDLLSFRSVKENHSTSLPNFKTQLTNHELLDIKNCLLSCLDQLLYFHNLTKNLFFSVNQLISESYNDHFTKKKKILSSKFSKSKILISHKFYSQLKTDDVYSDKNSFICDDKRICLELSYKDIKNLQLNPKSDFDLMFLKEFILIYWKFQVSDVKFKLSAFY